MSTVNMAAIVKAFAGASTGSVIAPGPSFKTSPAGDAVKRCRSAWHRTFEASVAMRRDRKQDELFLKEDAAEDASKAHRNAMPLLSGSDGISDFIACVAHGVLIDAITPQMSTQLLYAAQVAVGARPRQPESPKEPRPKNTPPPG